MLDKDIILSYIPEIEKFLEHKNLEVKAFAAHVKERTQDLLDGKISKEEFDDKNYLTVPDDGSADDEEKLARNALNYIKNRVLEFYVFR